MHTATRAFLAVLLATALLGACERKPAPPAAAVESVASVDGVAIRYETIGKGEPTLLLVHCWTCNRSFWDAQVAEFGTSQRVVRLDLAGHGESGRNRKDYTVESFGADVAAVADKLGLQQVVLVGHSMGGPVALEAEKRLGRRVLGIVGVDTFHTGFRPLNKEQAEEFVRPFEQNFAQAAARFMSGFFAPGAHPALVDRIAKNTATVDQAMAINALRNVLAWYGRNMPAMLERLGPKVRNINGDPKGDAKPLHESVTLIAGAGHFPAQERPAEFNRALRAIVAGFTTASP